MASPQKKWVTKLMFKCQHLPDIRWACVFILSYYSSIPHQLFVMIYNGEELINHFLFITYRQAGREGAACCRLKYWTLGIIIRIVVWFVWNKIWHWIWNLHCVNKHRPRGENLNVEYCFVVSSAMIGQWQNLQWFSYFNL